MLAALCVLLPAIVVGAQHPIRPVAGEWTASVRDGATLITHDGSAWPGKEGFPLALFNVPGDFSGGTARIDFMLIDGSDDFSAGLVFGHGGGTTYYYVRYNTKDGNVALWRMDGPVRTVIRHGGHHQQLPRHTWHRLVLTVEGRRVRAAVAGTPLEVEHVLDAPVSGRLGLWTKPDVTTAFRNLQVSESRH